MLDSGRPPQRIAGLTLFYDHADEHRRYVLAETPRLVANPTPQLSLVLFRGEQSGGLLQFESTLAPTEAQLAKAEQELLQTGRRVTLARPDWRRGTVHVAGWLQTDELKPLMLAVGPPMLVGDPMAVVAARLDVHGAALADAALKGNALPTVLIFELETLGLSGPLGVEAEADLQAIHDRLTAEGALTTPYGYARIAKTWEMMERENLIRIRVVDESGDFESQRAETMRRVGEDLIAGMFSPFPPQEKPKQLEDGSVAPLELSFRLTVRREELSTTSRWSFLERRAMPIRHYAAASLVDLLGDSPAADHIHLADLTTDQRQIMVRVEPELAALGLAAVEVDLRYTDTDTGDDADENKNDDRDVDQTVVLTDEQPQVQITTDRITGTPRYRVRTRFDPDQTRATDRESGWLEAPSDLILVSARYLFPPRTLTVIAGRAEFDWLDHVEVAIDTPQELPRSLILDRQTRSADAYFPAAGDGPLSVTAHWRGVAGEPSQSDPIRTVEDDILVLDSPFGDSINVLVVPRPSSQVLSMTVDLRMTHNGFTHNKSVSWESPDSQAQRVGLRRPADSPRRYEYRVSLVHQDGTLDTGDWTSEDKTVLVVPTIEAGQTMVVHNVEIVLLGGGPSARDSFAIELALTAAEHHTQQVLQGTQDQARLVLMTPQGAPPPVLVAREFLNSGQVRETRWENPDALIVLPPVSLVPQTP